MGEPEFETVNVGGIETACVDREGLVQLIGQICQRYSDQGSKKREPFVIFDNNGHAISIYNLNKKVRNQIKRADLVHADGQSVVNFSRWFKGVSVPERSATTDLIHDIPKLYQPLLKHFLLGGKENSVSIASNVLTKTYSNFEIVGFQNGYFGPNEESAICERINAAKPDVLWVGLGKPKEQEFCINNKYRLDVPVIISCGGCYNYVTGEYPRAPLWMQTVGLEWFFRMINDPRKLFVRYLFTNPHAIYCVIKHRFLSRVS